MLNACKDKKCKETQVNYIMRIKSIIVMVKFVCIIFNTKNKVVHAPLKIWCLISQNDAIFDWINYNSTNGSTNMCGRFKDEHSTVSIELINCNTKLRYICNVYFSHLPFISASPPQFTFLTLRSRFLFRMVVSILQAPMRRTRNFIGKSELLWRQRRWETFN